jgi:glycosyltransferase involved in cell wall biosynthesis
MKTTITGVIITLNEEENLERCLRSISGLVTEILIVDSGSTDKTINIAKKFGAKIFKRKFDNFSSQRNYGISKATSEWILSLDADEEIPKKLAKEIQDEVEKEEYDAFLIPRKNIIFGKEIKHTRWSPDKHVWLFRKSKAKFVSSIHEEVKVHGKIGELENAKVHHSHKTVRDFINMMNTYTDLEADALVKSGTKFSYFSLFYYPVRSFIGRYFVKKGFLDGWRGFVLSYLRAMYQFSTWVKVWERS